MLSKLLGRRFHLSDKDVEPVPDSDDRILQKVKLDKCRKCLRTLGPDDFVCGECGTANTSLINKEPEITKADEDKCNHHYVDSLDRYICVFCGSVIHRNSRIRLRTVPCYKTCKECGEELTGIGIAQTADRESSTGLVLLAPENPIPNRRQRHLRPLLQRLPIVIHRAFLKRE